MASHHVNAKLGNPHDRRILCLPTPFCGKQMFICPALIGLLDLEVNR